MGNLVDGVNKTRDDLHMWLAPYTAGRDHLVWMRFHSTTTLAMIRIWVSGGPPMTCGRGVASEATVLAMIRIWVSGGPPLTCGRGVASEVTVLSLVTHTQNYNKSRIHSYRGARDIEMYLDGQMIFKGEIAR